MNVLFSLPGSAPPGLYQSISRVSPHNLSLKAIIIRSLRPSHRGNMGSAFIRQMERGWSRPQCPPGNNTGGWRGGGLYEVVRMIDRDDLDLIMSYGPRGEMRMRSSNIWIQERGEMTVEGCGAKDGKHRCILVHWKYIFFSSFDLFRMNYCQEHSPCHARRLAARCLDQGHSEAMLHNQDNPPKPPGICTSVQLLQV